MESLPRIALTYSQTCVYPPLQLHLLRWRLDVFTLGVHVQGCTSVEPWRLGPQDFVQSYSPSVCCRVRPSSIQRRQRWRGTCGYDEKGSTSTSTAQAQAQLRSSSSLLHRSVRLYRSSAYSVTHQALLTHSRQTETSRSRSGTASSSCRGPTLLTTGGRASSMACRVSSLVAIPRLIPS